MITLVVTYRTDPRLLELMDRHYSKPKGFVGRNIPYAIYYDGVYYGHTIAGSTPKHLPRNHKHPMDQVINNIFFHIEPIDGKYPIRNFAQKVVSAFRVQATIDWERKYGDKVLALESLVELPRTGEVYKRDGWVETGITKGFTCKREAGIGTDSYSGKRVWDTINIRPKRVFCIEYQHDLGNVGRSMLIPNGRVL